MRTLDTLVHVLGRNLISFVCLAGDVSFLSPEENMRRQAAERVAIAKNVGAKLFFGAIFGFLLIHKRLMNTEFRKMCLQTSLLG